VATPKVLLYYAFADLPDPEAVRLWQHALCDALDLRGRIIVAPHGINATLGGDVVELKTYVRATKAYAPFRDAAFKWSEGRARPDGTTADFPRLSVKVRPELVAFGAPDAVSVDGHRVANGGTHLDPVQLHELVEREDVVFFDGRNRIESAIGRFRGAVVPPVDTTREFVDLLDSGAYDHLKDRPVVTYCTGGIRCEILTPLMRERGFAQVYQLDGGIATYGETFGDDGLWEGSLYVFDDRMTMDFSDHAAVIGRCDTCDRPTSAVVDCSDAACVVQFVRCDACAADDPGCTAHGDA
jgi:UPF0176 protein